MVVATLTREFLKVKALADGAIAQLDDAQLHARIDPEANSVAMLMHHLAGNMQSRWTDFLTSDGEKPWRQRDAEFEPPPGDRAALLASWEAGWTTLFAALDGLARRRSRPLRHHPRRGPDGAGRHRAAARPLRRPCPPDRAAGQAPARRRLAGPVDPARPVAGLHRPAAHRSDRRRTSHRPGGMIRTMDATTPTVLWRLCHDRGAQARAVLIPGEPQSTLTIFVNDVMDRAENFDTIDVALFRADDIEGVDAGRRLARTRPRAR